jgi:hypothetical protein
MLTRVRLAVVDEGGRMYARVVTWEGGEKDKVREMVERIQQQADEHGGPPEGVPSTGLMVLHNEDGSKVMAIGLFETDADYEEGDATLNSMDPPTPGGLGQRIAVERWEVGIKVDANR